MSLPLCGGIKNYAKVFKVTLICTMSAYAAWHSCPPLTHLQEVTICLNHLYKINLLSLMGPPCLQQCTCNTVQLLSYKDEGHQRSTVMQSTN